MKKSKICNSPLVGMGSVLLIDSLFIFFLVTMQDYLTLSRKHFVMFVAILTLLVLVANALFVLGFALKKIVLRKILLGYTLVFSLIFSVGIYYGNRLNKGIDALIDQDGQEFVDYSFVSLEEGQTLDNLMASETIGYVLGDDEFNTSIEKEITTQSPTVKVETFERYEDLLEAFVADDEVDVAILPKRYTNYIETMDEEDQALLLSANVFHEFNIGITSDPSRNAQVLEEPFTILMMGINDNLADSIILVSVNPKTLNVTMTSVARDSFVPISCYAGQSYDKINHSRGRSRQCMINTIENVFDIDIDFFFETDFYALVKIVDVLGGLELESPIAFGGSLPKEENPREYHEIYIPQGKTLMNGYQAITFARERAHFGSGDFQRQLNQQYVIKELAQKIFAESKKNADTLIKVLEAAGDNIVMNLNMNRDIAPLLGYALNNISASPVDAMDTFNIQSTQLYGMNAMINDISYVIPYQYSLDDISAMIKNNLSTEIDDPKETPFAFSINYPYSSGKNMSIYQYYGTPLITNRADHEIEEETYTVPDFTSMSLAEVQNWADRHDVELSVRYIDETHDSYADHYEDGQIIYQSTGPGDYDEMPSYIEISVIEKIFGEPLPDPIEPEDPDDDEMDDTENGEGEEPTGPDEETDETESNKPAES